MVIGWIVGGEGLAGNIAPQTIHVPIWGWIIIMFSGLVAAQFLAYKSLRKKHVKQVITPNQIEGLLTLLAKRREEGARILYNGLNINNENEVPQWINHAEYWRRQVKNDIKNLSPSMASIFHAQVVVDTKLFKKKALNDMHGAYLAMLNEDTEKIKQLVEKLSLENLATKSGITE